MFMKVIIKYDNMLYKNIQLLLDFYLDIFNLFRIFFIQVQRNSMLLLGNSGLIDLNFMMF